MMRRILCLLLLGLILPPFLIYSAQAQESLYLYEYSKGEEAWNLEFTILKKDDGIVIKIMDEAKNEVYVYDHDFFTYSHEIVDLKEETDFKKIREDNIISIKGVVKGEKIDKKIEIDSRPWHQNFEFCLSGFAKSSQTKKEFWVINAEDFSAYIMSARKRGLEKIEVNGEVMEAQKVELRLSGFLSLFWKAECWYRRSDGIFLMYKGTSGPGTPEMTVIMHKEEEIATNL